jgi:ribosomal protein S18 acetylase RimI-like enzyme
MPDRTTVTIAAITAAEFDAASELLRLTLIESGSDPNVITERYVAGWIGSGAPVLGARVGAHLVGYAMLERGPLSCGVVAPSVLQRHRRQGLGERLMRGLLAEARRSGEIDEVWLSVAPDNLPARTLYGKLGFVDRADPPSTMSMPANYLSMLWRPDR